MRSVAERAVEVLNAALAFALMTYAMKLSAWELVPGWMVVLAGSIVELKSSDSWDSPKDRVVSVLLLIATSGALYVHIIVERDPNLALGLMWVYLLNLFAAGVALVRLLAHK